jgi:hypothetical protein
MVALAIHRTYAFVMKEKQLTSWDKTLLEDFQGCLEKSLACIGPRRAVYLPAMVPAKGVMDIAVWYLKLWPIMTSGFGMLFLAWQDLKITLMFYNTP